MDYDTTARPTDFPIDSRVELHPACDLRMRGARFGTVRNHTRHFVMVEMDHAQLRQPIRVAPALLRAV